MYIVEEWSNSGLGFTKWTLSWGRVFMFHLGEGGGGGNDLKGSILSEMVVYIWTIDRSLVSL